MVVTKTLPIASASSLLSFEVKPLHATPTAVRIGPEVSVTVSATARASSRDEDTRIVDIFHRIYQNSPLDGRSVNVTVGDAHVLVAAWAQNAGYTSSDLTSDDFIAFVNEKAPSTNGAHVPETDVAPMPPSPKESVPSPSYTKEEDDQIIATFHRLMRGGPEDISAKEARKLVEGYYRDINLDTPCPGGQQKAAMLAENKKRAEYTEASTRLFSDAIGLPKGSDNGGSFLFARMSDQIAAENGLSGSTVPPVAYDEADVQKSAEGLRAIDRATGSHEAEAYLERMAEAKQLGEKRTLEYRSVATDAYWDRTAQTKELQIVFDRTTAASAFGKTLTLVPSNAETPFGGQLNTDQRSQLDDLRKGMSGHGIAASQVHSFDVIDETGRAVGMVLSVGWDDLAQEKGASMLENAFRILQRATDYAV